MQRQKLLSHWVLDQAQWTLLYFSCSTGCTKSKASWTCSSTQKVEIFLSLSSNFTGSSNRSWISILLSFRLLRAPTTCPDAKIAPKFIISTYWSIFVSLTQDAWRIPFLFLNKAFRMHSYFFGNHLPSSSNCNPSCLNTSLLGYY